MKYKVTALRDKDSEIRNETLEAPNRAQAMTKFLDWYGETAELKVMYGIKIERIK